MHIITLGGYNEGNIFLGTSKKNCKAQKAQERKQNVQQHLTRVESYDAFTTNILSTRAKYERTVRYIKGT